MMTNTRWLVAPILVCLSQDVRSQDSPTPVDLTPYLVQPKAQESGPSGFQLAFAGEASHRLQFQYGAEEAVELQVSVGYPAGGARTLRRLLEPGPEGAQVVFDLGPLLAHGPYRPIPAYTRKGPQARSWRPLRTGWWVDTQDPGKYLVTVMGRRVRDGQTLFTTDLRLPVQNWVGADLDRLAYIDDNAAEVELWLEKGAPVTELPVEVDLVEARTGSRRSSSDSGPPDSGQGPGGVRPDRPGVGDLSRSGPAPDRRPSLGRRRPAGSLRVPERAAAKTGAAYRDSGGSPVVPGRLPDR